MRRSDPGGEQRTQPRGLGLACEQPDEWFQARNLKGAHQLNRAFGRPESGQRLEVRQRNEQFRLVAAIAVIAHRGVQRHAAAILALIAVEGLFGAGVRLQRQRFIGGEHFDEEGQHIAEPVPHRGAELGLRIGTDGSRQRRLTAGALQVGRVAGMGAQPQLRLGMGRRSRPAGELGDRAARAPGVSTNRSA